MKKSVKNWEKSRSFGERFTINPLVLSDFDEAICMIKKFEMI